MSCTARVSSRPGLGTRWHIRHRDGVGRLTSSFTSSAFKEVFKKSTAAGCIAHLTKTIKKKTLLVAIVQYANSSSALTA
jgi:hypothetical protein